MGAGQLNKTGLQNGPAPLSNFLHTGAVAVIVDHLKAIGGRGHGGAQAQVRETGESYRRRAYGA